MPSWSNAKYGPIQREMPTHAVMRRLDAMLRNGATLGFAARRSGVTIERARKYQSSMTRLPKLCGCGEHWKKPHDCWWRVNSVLVNREALQQLRDLRRARLAIQQILIAVRGL